MTDQEKEIRIEQDIFYFAYGSNMDRDQMKKRKINFSHIYRGKLNNYRLVFNKIGNDSSGKANIINDKDSFVEGVIYKIDVNSLKRLDYYERVNVGHYHQEKVCVTTEIGILNCITYIANKDKTRDGLKPIRAYLDHLLKSKKYLSRDYYESLSKTITFD